MLTASLKENNDAILVGLTTYGKGKVQNLDKLLETLVLKARVPM